jgi:hypothetical protein
VHRLWRKGAIEGAIESEESVAASARSLLGRGCDLRGDRRRLAPKTAAVRGTVERELD